MWSRKKTMTFYYIFSPALPPSSQKGKKIKKRKNEETGYFTCILLCSTLKCKNRILVKHEKCTDYIWNRVVPYIPSLIISRQRTQIFHFFLLLLADFSSFSQNHENIDLLNANICHHKIVQAISFYRENVQLYINIYICIT